MEQNAYENPQMYGGGDSTPIYQPSNGDYNPHFHYLAAQAAGFKLTSAIGQTHTLYVGNLDPRLTEDYVNRWFSQAGQVTKVKVEIDANNLAYAFVEFYDANIPAALVRVTGKQEILGREVKMACVVPYGRCNYQSRVYTTIHFTIYVGNLPRDLNDYKQLINIFSEFGKVPFAKIARDPNTFKSKRYGFVSFEKREDAENAIKKANGAKIGNYVIRVNWAAQNHISNETQVTN